MNPKYDFDVETSGPEGTNGRAERLARKVNILSMLMETGQFVI